MKSKKNFITFISCFSFILTLYFSTQKIYATVKNKKTMVNMERNQIRKTNVGMILLSADLTTEREFKNILPEQFEIFTTRVKYHVPLNSSNLRKVESELKSATENLVPGYPLDIISFGCTSGSISIGNETVAERIHSARPESDVTTPSTAAIKALKMLKSKKISMLTPYTKELTQEVVKYVENEGIKVSKIHALGLTNDIEIAQVDPKKIYQEAIALYKKDSSVDALFISCTGLKAVEAIEAIENEIGIPVLSSNQVVAWEILKKGQYNQSVLGYGKLLTKKYLIN